MKRLIFALFAVLLFASYVPAQHVEIFNLGTVYNSVLGSTYYETVYLDLSNVQKNKGWSRVDSVLCAIYVENETDIDSLDIYPGFKGYKGGVEETAFGTAITQTVTLNVAAASTGYEELLTSNATPLTSLILRQNNYIKFVTKGATSGNDPTDPNKGWLICYVYGAK